MISRNGNTQSIKSNPYLPNIDAISGALFTLRIQFEYTQTQCDEGARDGINIWLMGIIRSKTLEVLPITDFKEILECFRVIITKEV